MKVNSNSYSPNRMKHIPVDFRITRSVEELLSLLVGMNLCWGLSPQDYLQQKMSRSHREILLKVFYRMGYIDGDVDNWNFTEKLLKKVVNRGLESLSKIGAIGSKMPYKPSLYASRYSDTPQEQKQEKEPQISVLQLRKIYANKLKTIPKENWPSHKGNVFPQMRKLS